MNTMTNPAPVHGATTPAVRARLHTSLSVLALLGLVGLVGCATPPGGATAPDATHDRIAEEMRQAVQRPAPTASPTAVQQALLPPLTMEPPRATAAAAAPPEPRFDLAVANAPAQQVFLSIVSGTRYSMLLPAELSGTIAVNLKNVTVREALDALRELYGYEYRIQGNRILVQPNTLQTRIFQVNYLAGKRVGSTDMRVTSGSITNNANSGSQGGGASSTTAQNNAGGSGGNSSSAGVQSSRVSTESDNDFWGELRNTLGAIVGNEGNRKVIINPLSGVVAVRGFPADIRNAENYLRMTQLIIERQVMIEAKIIEVQLSDSQASGVNWGAFRQGNNSGVSIGQAGAGGVLGTTGSAKDLVGTLAGLTATTLTATAGSTLLPSNNNGSLFGLAFQSGNFAALLQFLETQGNVQVLSSPRIATLNNQKAVLKVGTDEYFVTNITTNSSSTGTTTTNSPSISMQPFFSGIALDVTPQIDDNDGIILHLHPSVSVVAEKQKIVNLGTLGNFNLPLASSTVNESDSVVRVTDGHIVAIGGLMKQQQSAGRSGLPGTSDAGALGGLFGEKNRSATKSELVLLLKPTLIRNDGNWASDLAEVQERLQSYAPSAQMPASPTTAAR
jgi:MSHA biogenesis protein MshL